MAGITARPIPVNEPRLITPRTKTDILSAIRDLVLRDFVVPRGDVARVTAAVAKALASLAKRSNVGPPLYMLRTTHGDIARVVRLEMVSIEREEANRKAREREREEARRRERQRERAAAAAAMGGGDIDDGWPPTAKGQRRAHAMDARECITHLRALPAVDVEEMTRVLDDRLGGISPATLRSLDDWADLAGDEAAEAWLEGFLQPPEGESAMAEALRDMRRAEREADLARARLAGASRSYGLLSGSRAGGARALGLSLAALNSLCNPGSRHSRRSPHRRSE